jgi:glycine betaine/proline transport system ATP-binding protein
LDRVTGDSRGPENRSDICTRFAADVRGGPALGEASPVTSPAEVLPERTGVGGDVQVSCRDVWKVFGPHADKVIGSSDADLPRAELMAKTGCTIASRDISFDVGRGEVFVIMGLSGSGKSTLVRCITRLVEPTSGRISICGQDVLGADAKRLREIRRTKVSMVFQHFGLFPHRTVIDNVAYGLEVQGIDKTKRHERARELLGVVGLASVERSYPDQLSGGMQQRVGLARALAVDPEVLIFDEAFSALDPLIRREMQDEVLRLQARLHKTVLFVTHDLDEALKIGDRIAIMKDGRFVQVGLPSEIVGAPADDYVREFVRDVPRGKVLTASFATQPHTGAVTPENVVQHDQRLGELLPVIFGSTGPIGVVDASGELVGVLDRRMVVHVLAGRDEHDVPEEPAFDAGPAGPA